MKINFNLLWKLYQVEVATKIDFHPLLDYSKFTPEWVEKQRAMMGKNFYKEFPFGLEDVSIKKMGNLTIIKFSNLPRQCGKTKLSIEFCKMFSNSIYLNPKSTTANHKKSVFGINACRCSRPRDLDFIRGKHYDAICFDDLELAEIKDLDFYLPHFISMAATKPLILLVF